MKKKKRNRERREKIVSVEVIRFFDKSNQVTMIGGQGDRSRLWPRVFCNKQKRQWCVERLRWNKAGGGLKQMHDWAHLFDSWDFCEKVPVFIGALRGVYYGEGYITFGSILTKLLN